MRLLVHVEGETEESFVNEVLADYLGLRGFSSVSARIIGNSRQRRNRGGIQAWPIVRKGIINHLKEDRSCLVTTMVDYYGLPASGQGGWPGRDIATSLQFPDKATSVERALLADVQAEAADSSISDRFIPFVVMHEFEGLLFSNCDGFAKGIGRSELTPELQEIRDQFGTPEEINDSSITAPSKRVKTLVADYEKPLHGTLAALEIGLDQIRNECPHFNCWLDKLIAIATT